MTAPPFRHLLTRSAVALALVLASAPVALAQDYANRIAAELASQGYRAIETERTWLGRTRITAARGRAEREIILNPLTGEVLRDLLHTTSGSSPGMLADDSHNSGSTSGSGSGDDDGDDNSGSGSGDDGGSDDNSGHGGGSDGGSDDNSGSGSGSDGGSDGGDDD